MPSPEVAAPTIEEKQTRRRRAWIRRLKVYGSLLAILWGFYVWQPIEIDFIPRSLPPKARIDPDSAHLFTKGTKVMVIAAHPDDSEFYSAGTFLQLAQAGCEMTHLVHTDGDKAYYFWADNSPLRETRRKEQREASGRWNAKEVRFLGYPDGRLRENSAVTGATVKAIQDWKPDYIVCFDPEYPPRSSHQDHRRSGEIAFAAAKAANFKGWMLCYSSMAPNYAVDVDPVWSDRMALIAIHASQFSGEKLKWIQAHLADNAVNQGEAFGFAFAEAYRSVRLPLLAK